MKALLLDLDDTLLDYSGGIDGCWAHACAEAGCAVEQEQMLSALLAVRREFWREAERHRRERTNMLGAWTKIARLALESCGADVQLGATIASAYAARRRTIMQLFPDALKCLAAIQARGIPLAMITNGDASEQRDKIERHRLAPFFQTILIEGEFGAGKPDETVYAAALERLGVAPGPDIWMVGDHLEFDVAGPQRLGLRAAWLDRSRRGLPGDSSVRPDRVLYELTDLLPTLAGPAAIIELSSSQSRRER
jgi:putative hydrolase of the HAD superfamily